MYINDSILMYPEDYDRMQYLITEGEYSCELIELLSIVSDILEVDGYSNVGIIVGDNIWTLPPEIIYKEAERVMGIVRETEQIFDHVEGQRMEDLEGAADSAYENEDENDP